MKTTIYLVRHGQSMGNLRDQFMGHTDTPLTELGFRQAELAAEYMQSIHLDAIYSSDLQRAYNTALATAKRKNMPVTKTENMREIFGGKWETVEFPQLHKEFPEDFNTWCSDFKNCRCTGGGQSADVRADNDLLHISPPFMRLPRCACYVSAADARHASAAALYT